MEVKNIAETINALAMIAMALSLYLTYLHYSLEEGPCNINEELNCDIVNKSQWSEMFGISIAFFGFLTFLLVFIINIFIIKEKKEFLGFNLTRKGLVNFEFVINTWNLIYSAYLLTYVSYYKLQGIYCPLCLVVDAIILAIFILSILMLKGVKNGKENA